MTLFRLLVYILIKKIYWVLFNAIFFLNKCGFKLYNLFVKLKKYSNKLSSNNKLSFDLFKHKVFYKLKNCLLNLHEFFLLLKSKNLFIFVFYKLKNCLLNLHEFFLLLKSKNLFISVFIKLIKLLIYYTNFLYFFFKDKAQIFFFWYTYFMLLLSIIFKYVSKFIFFIVYNILHVIFYFSKYLLILILNLFLELLKKNRHFNLLFNLLLDIKLSKKTYKEWILLIKIVFLKNFKVLSNNLYWFFYEIMFYEVFLGLVLAHSYASNYREGLNFTSREDILQTWHSYYVDLKRIARKYGSYYELRYDILKFIDFYRIFVINFFFFFLKKYIIRHLFYIQNFFKKNYINNFLFLLILLFIFKFGKILILTFCFVLLKLKFLFAPFYVILNFYRKLRKRFFLFFKNIRLRFFRHFTLNWLFFFSKPYKTFFTDCKFRFKYKRRLKNKAFIPYSIFDHWYNFWTDNFIFKFFKRKYNKWYKRFKLHRFSIRLKHKIGMGDYGIIKYVFERIFFGIILTIFKLAYVLAIFFSFIIKKIIKVIKKIIKNANK